MLLPAWMNKKLNVSRQAVARPFCGIEFIYTLCDCGVAKRRQWNRRSFYKKKTGPTKAWKEAICRRAPTVRQGIWFCFSVAVKHISRAEHSVSLSWFRHPPVGAERWICWSTLLPANESGTKICSLAANWSVRWRWRWGGKRLHHYVTACY